MKKIILSLIVFCGCSFFVFGEDITATKTVKTFFKENTNLQMSKDGSEIYKDILNKLSLKVIKKATELAKAEKRKTVLERDIKKASDEIFRQAPMTIDELMEKIKLLSIIDLAELSKQVKNYGKDLLEKRPK